MATDVAASMKIARLTRVIATLHAECEDARDEREKDERARVRERELTRYEASNAILREVRAKEEAREATTETYAACATKNALAHAKATNAMDSMRTRMEEEARAFEIRDEERAREMGRSIEAMRADCDRARQATERAREEALRVETETRMRVVENARVTEERLRGDLEFERDDRARRETEFARDLAECRARCAAEIDKVNAEAAARAREMNRILGEKDDEIRTIRNDFDGKLADERDKGREKSERQRLAYEFLEKMLGEAQSELEATRRAYSAARDALDELKCDRDAQSDTIEMLTSTLSAREARVEELTAEVERLAALSADIAVKLNQTQDAYVASIKERGEMSDMILDLNTQREATGAAHAMKIERLNATLQESRDALATCESSMQQAIENAARDNVQHAKEIEIQQSTHQREREELETSYEARIKAMDVERSARHAHILEEQAVRARDIEANHAKEIESLEHSWMQSEVRWEEERSRLRAELASANALTIEAKNLSDTHRARQQTLETDLERVIAAFRAKELALNGELRESKLASQAVEAFAHKLENELGERAMEYETKRLEAESASRVEIERLNSIWERKMAENVNHALKELQRMHESAMERLTVELTAQARADCARAVANVSDAYQAVERELRDELSGNKREYEKQSLDRAAKFEKDVTDLRTDFERRLASMSSSHAQEIETLSKSHAERLEYMQADHERSLQRSMSEAVRLAVSQVEAQHEIRLSESAEKMRLEKASELKRVNDDYSKELEHLDREYELKLESCLTVSDALELERESLRDQLRRARDELAAESLKRSTENEKSREALAATANARERDIESLRSEHKETVMRMQSSNESAMRAANDALSASKAEVSKWRAVYENREARPEDLKRIEDLELELAVTNERLERSAAHRRTLQTELLGRAREFDKTPTARRAAAAYGRG